MSNTTELYNVPRNSWVKLLSGQVIYFDHIDGMYSYCKDQQGNVYHVGASTMVEVLTEGRDG